MTDPAPPPPETPAAPSPAGPEAREYVEKWAASLTQVLGQIVGSPFAVECLLEAPASAPPPADSDLQVIVAAAGALRGEMSLRIPRPAGLGLAQLFLSEAQDAAAEFKSDHPEALEELLRQVAGHAATALKARWGEVQLQLASGTPPSWSAGARGWLVSVGEASGRLQMEWQLSAALYAALVAAGGAPGASSREVAPGADPPGDAASSPADGNLDLLMNVELEVTLRFGERRMLLREVLELGAGSVVELDRGVEEPVDLLLDDRLIARGEVVIVDGNYGLRVLEVVTQPKSA